MNKEGNRKPGRALMICSPLVGFFFSSFFTPLSFEKRTISFHFLSTTALVRYLDTYHRALG